MAELCGNSPGNYVNVSVARAAMSKAARGRTAGALPTIVEIEHALLAQPWKVVQKVAGPMDETSTDKLMLAEPASRVLFDSLALDGGYRKQLGTARLKKAKRSAKTETTELRAQTPSQILGTKQVDAPKHRDLFAGLVEERPASQVLVDVLGLDAGCFKLRRATRSSKAKTAKQAGEPNAPNSPQIAKVTWQHGKAVMNTSEEEEICSTASTASASCGSLPEA